MHLTGALVVQNVRKEGDDAQPPPVCVTLPVENFLLSDLGGWSPPPGSVQSSAREINKVGSFPPTLVVGRRDFSVFVGLEVLDGGIPARGSKIEG